MDTLVGIPREKELNGITVVFDENYQIEKGRRGYVVLDFYRKFEDPDLEKLPAKLIPLDSPEQGYMIRKYEVILGEFSDLW